jgi:UPF0271 protein
LIAIDLSCDLGEAATEADRRLEAEIWPLITSANIACGGHTGDAATMRDAVENARRCGVSAGAHPSYPDRENFGRRSMSIDDVPLGQSLREQISALRDIAAAADIVLTHVKPHGALYNDAQVDIRLAGVILDAVVSVSPSMAVVCAGGSAVEEVAKLKNVRVVREGFADRRYQRNGNLVGRSRPDALLLDAAEAAAQACSIVIDRRVFCDDGSSIDIHAQTVCVHSDMPGSPARLRAIRSALMERGVRFRSVHG